MKQTFRFLHFEQLDWLVNHHVTSSNAFFSFMEIVRSSSKEIPPQVENRMNNDKVVMVSIIGILVSGGKMRLWDRPDLLNRNIVFDKVKCKLLKDIPFICNLTSLLDKSLPIKVSEPLFCRFSRVNSSSWVTLMGLNYGSKPSMHPRSCISTCVSAAIKVRIRRYWQEGQLVSLMLIICLMTNNHKIN